jgi:glyoxylase-like metal-dependent hydrolase (beta-lactamase superfamily II)
MTLIQKWLIALCAALGAAAWSAPAGTLAAADRYRVHALGNDVYVLVYDSEVEVEGNTLIIVNDDNVVVVDSNAGLTTAKMTISEIKKITAKPVRYVVNTHWHDDHVMGNQAYADAYPGVEFIAHPETRRDIIGHAFANNAYVIDLIDADITRLNGYLESGIGRDGKPMTPDQTERVRKARDVRIEMAGDRRAFRPVPPTIDVADAKTLTFGGRKIEVRFLGRGNTRGDLVVYLPNERVLATGDLVVWPVPYATNAYAGDWIRTLDVMMTTPATTIVPGHGPLMKDWSYVRRVKNALEKAQAEVSTMKRGGRSLDETVKNVQLPELRAEFLDGKETRALSFELNFRASLVRNLWEELDTDIMKIMADADFTQVADGVYAYELGTSRRLASLIVNDKDVVLVTAARSAAEARSTIRATRELTDKPVRFIVNTAVETAGVIDAYESVYGAADVFGYAGSKRAITIEGELTLHRGAREIVIRQPAGERPAVYLPAQNLVLR